MSIQPQVVTVNFQEGLNTKTDPYQVPSGQFLQLENSVFSTQGQLKKRNGYELVTTIPNSATVTTYSGNLVSLGTNSFNLYSEDTQKTINSGYIQPMSLNVKPLVRRATGQTTVDSVIAPNGLVCSTWLDSDGNSYYQINDSSTGGTIVPFVKITSATDVSATMSRVFCLGSYFIITFISDVSGTPTLRYIAIPYANPSSPLSPVTISSQVSSISAAYDGVIDIQTPEILFLAWNGSDIGGAVRICSISSSLVIGYIVTIGSQSADLISLAWDNISFRVWVTFYTLSTNTIKTTAYDQNLTPYLTSTTVVSSVTLFNGLTTTVNNGLMNVFYEVSNKYGYDSSLRTDYISTNSCTISATIGTPSIILRSVGLGSKAIYIPSTNKSYMLAVYGSAYQPTYFLIDSSGNIIGKLAYSNGGGYAINQILPQINISYSGANAVLQIGYLFKDFLASIANPVGPLGSNVGTNKTQGSSNTVPLYTQTGINLSVFTFNSPAPTAETGNILHMGAGFPWMFDGVKPVEHQFHLWPDAVEVTTATGSGSITAQQYYYQAIYYWMDGQGNQQFSAPSIPVGILTTTSSSTNTIYIPTIRLTYKNTNKVIIKLYRWSTAFQEYYEVTSVSSPTLNNTSVDYITFVDTQADSAIQGNSLIYTTGGVVEDVAAPSFSVCSMFDDRLWIVDAEDPYMLWYSKQVINGTGVEFSDLFTYYVAPTIGAQGSTGSITALAPMDTELVIFKKDAIYYVNGSGPDNTGAGNNYSQPIYISSTVGCANPNSVVLTDNGIMFQSDKGIWLLSRSLQPSYIGMGVEKYVLGNTVTSATVIPGTTQVRFTMNTGITVMYDYLYNQWGTFTNTPAISSTLYQGLHTYLNPYGQIVQESPGIYLDISTPVLLSFTTSWIQLGGISGYQRLWEFLLIGNYESPHLLNVQLGYDYGPLYEQAVIQPTNYTGSYGSDQLYGQTTPYGGQVILEQWRIQQSTQICQSFQIAISEVYDPSLGVNAGSGFTLSALTCVVGVMRGYRPIRAENTAGTN